MTILEQTEGTALFPFQTEAGFVWAVCSATAKQLVHSIRTHISSKQYWSAWLCFCLLMVYVALIAGVVWVVMPWFKAFITAKFVVSPWWFWPVKGMAIRVIGKMVCAIHRKIAPAL